MQIVTDQTDTNGEHPPRGRSGLRELLLPDRLRPPPWGRFRGRWSLLLAICALWLAALKTPFLWPGDKVALNLFYSAAALLLLWLGVTVYGPARLRKDLEIKDLGSTAWHVLILIVAWGLAGHFLAARTPVKGVATAVPVDKVLVLSAILARGLLGPLAEEFALRFVFFRFLRLRVRFPLAALGCAVVFGALHLSTPENPLPVVRAMLMGLISCWAFERTGSIVTPAIAHVITNLLSDMQ